MRKSRDFTLRSIEEQNWLQKETWCNTCGKADLGMKHPAEYEESGEVFLQGSCKVCGEVVRSTIHESVSK